jgi:hypothetical protein
LIIRVGTGAGAGGEEEEGGEYESHVHLHCRFKAMQGAHDPADLARAGPGTKRGEAFLPRSLVLANRNERPPIKWNRSW